MAMKYPRGRYFDLRFFLIDIEKGMVFFGYGLYCIVLDYGSIFITSLI